LDEVNSLAIPSGNAAEARDGSDVASLSRAVLEREMEVIELRRQLDTARRQSAGLEQRLGRAAEEAERFFGLSASLAKELGREKAPTDCYANDVARDAVRTMEGVLLHLGEELGAEADPDGVAGAVCENPVDPDMPRIEPSISHNVPEVPRESMVGAQDQAEPELSDTSRPDVTLPGEDAVFLGDQGSWRDPHGPSRPGKFYQADRADRFALDCAFARLDLKEQALQEKVDQVVCACSATAPVANSGEGARERVCRAFPYQEGMHEVDYLCPPDEPPSGVAVDRPQGPGSHAEPRRARPGLVLEDSSSSFADEEADSQDVNSSSVLQSSELKRATNTRSPSSPGGGLGASGSFSLIHSLTNSLRPAPALPEDQSASSGSREDRPILFTSEDELQGVIEEIHDRISRSQLAARDSQPQCTAAPGEAREGPASKDSAPTLLEDGIPAASPASSRLDDTVAAKLIELKEAVILSRSQQRELERVIRDQGEELAQNRERIRELEEELARERR